MREGEGTGVSRRKLRQEARKNKSVARHSPPLPRAELVAHGRRHARPVDPQRTWSTDSRSQLPARSKGYTGTAREPGERCTHYKRRADPPQGQAMTARSLAPQGPTRPGMDGDARTGE